MKSQTFAVTLTFLLLAIQSVQAQVFDTVINLPADQIAFPDFDSVGDNTGNASTTTQLNVEDDGLLGISFSAYSGSEVNINGGNVDIGFGANDGSIVNINGGNVGNGFGAGSGSIVNINGGNVGSGFGAGFGSVVNINGGNVGDLFDAFVNSEVNISGGTVGDYFATFPDSIVNISGGSVGDNFNNDGTVNISGGSVGMDFRLFADTTLNISGGSVGSNFTSFFGSVTNISGGTFSSIGTTFDGEVNFFGTEFFLDDIPLSSLILDEAFSIDVFPNDSILSGTLNDGSEFSYEIPDTFFPGTALSVTLTAVPEPSSIVLLMATSCGLVTRRRRSRS